MNQYQRMICYLYEYNNYNSIDKVYKNGSLFKEFNYDNLGRLTSYKINGLNKNITYHWVEKYKDGVQLK